MLPAHRTKKIPYENYESRVKLVHNAFNNPSYSETRLRSLHSSPSYQADLDSLVSAK